MGGLGKTTLAQKIYNHTSIKSYFSCSAWVSISQKWQTKQILQRILICLVDDKKEEILTWDDDKLVENLLQIQEKKKCLIVLDDIWSNDAWDSIKVAFTTERSISKLMLTSRKVDVAKYVNPKGLVHQPGYLSADQSWELLQMKALPTRGDCLAITRDVKRMEKLGREMVMNCAGLPLAIVILGGILVTKPSLIEWEKVYNDSLSSLKKGKGLGENQQKQLFDILVQSYNDLPSQLKPCFLYLGKFLEDEWINVETLYQLWIAEGMVLSTDKREGESMMQVAESYMGELVHKSMVQVRFDNMESSVTKFKSCSLHDLMRDLSLSQAKAEDFFEAIDLREGNDFHLNRSALSPVANTRQLTLYCDANNRRNRAHTYFVMIPNHQYYRSMLIRNVDSSGNFRQVFRLRFADYRLLRVLALERVFLDRRTVSGTLFGTNIGKELGSLVYLRYLSIGASLLKIFPWIQKLVLLQTLKLFKWFPIKILPLSSNSLGKLAHLRHLYLPNMINDSTGKYIKLRFNVFSKLETLENFNTEWCEVKDLPNLTRLQTLSLRIDGNYDDLEKMMKYLSILSLSSTSCLRYLALDIQVSDQGLLNNPDITRRWLWDQKSVLEELKIGGELPELGQLFEQQQLGGSSSATNVSLFRITKLKLSESCLKVDPMPVVEKIPTLRDLYLNHAYVGKEMVCSAMSFPKLTHLKLAGLLKLVKWRMEEGSMAMLKYLYLDECSEMEELPEGVRFLNSLERLGLHKMSSNFFDRIREEQGPDFYKVAHIHVGRVVWM